MLISFEVGNFRSIAEPLRTTFAARSGSVLSEQLIAVDAPATPQLTRIQALFGDNGAGKSNILAALSTLQNLVSRSMSCTESEFDAWYEPFQSAQWGDKPTTFSVDILIDSVRYSYALAFNARCITFERLLVYRAGKAQRWFQRERAADGRVHWEPFSAGLRGQREVWRQATRDRSLFLTTAAQLNAIDLIPLAQWFQEKLAVILTPAMHTDAVATLIADPRFKLRLLTTLQEVVPEVHDVRVVWREVAAGSRFPALEPQYSYERSGFGRMWMDGERESAGRVQLFLLTTLVLGAIKDGRCLCIDDFDASLHPASARRLVRLIVEDPASSATGTQLLLTSRNPALLDMGVLRRDELNLIERSTPRGSRLRSFASDERLCQLSDPAFSYGSGSIERGMGTDWTSDHGG